jgi:hypothetical protein
LVSDLLPDFIALNPATELILPVETEQECCD